MKFRQSFLKPIPTRIGHGLSWVFARRVNRRFLIAGELGRSDGPKAGSRLRCDKHRVCYFGLPHVAGAKK